jgi:hypothetical protein
VIVNHGPEKFLSTTKESEQQSCVVLVRGLGAKGAGATVC